MGDAYFSRKSNRVRFPAPKRHALFYTGLLINTREVGTPEKGTYIFPYVFTHFCSNFDFLYVSVAFTYPHITYSKRASRPEGTKFNCKENKKVNSSGATISP